MHVALLVHSNKSKYVYSEYGIVFDGTGLWNFGNDFAKNVIIFGVDNSSLSHNDLRKNTFLILGEETTDDINSSVGTVEKK